jgi:hypothetical protein
MMRTRLPALGVVLALLLAPAGARGLGLDVLVGGSSLDSGDGQLTFSAFEVVTTGSVPDDLSLFDVEPLADGLAITGPMSAAGGEIGDFFLQFTVSSRRPLRELQLAIEGEASGDGSSASVTETIDELEDAQLFAFVTGDGGERLSDSLAIEESTQLRLSKDVLVDAAPDGSARILRIEQRFPQAPEPAGLMSLGSALLGIALLRLRRGARGTER